MRTETLLRVNELSCIRQQIHIFNNISFELGAGEMLLVEGANGSGKSSLLRLLTGLASPSCGEIYWRNQLIQELRDEYWQEVHYIGHMNGLKLGLTVTENLCLSCHDVTFNTNILYQLQLQNHIHTQIKYLSAGQKRRVALAKLFLSPKKLWILDEPLTALDNQTQEYFFLQLESHLHQGGMAIITSHQPFKLPHIIPQVMRLIC